MTEEERKKHPNWGGRRPNQTGRPPKPRDGTEKRKHSIYCTKDELAIVREFLKDFRKKNDATELQ